MAGIFAGLALMEYPLALVIPVAALVAVSHLDDLRGLPIAVRFGAHFAAAIGFAWFALPGLPWPLLAAIVIGIVWVTNLYNFMDGSDGLAGGMSMFGFCFLGAGAWLAGDELLAIVCAIVAAASAAFLLFNFPPARIFMGDAGAVPLGFLAAALALAGWRDGDWPFWFPATVFAPFVFDATVTLARRMLAGERFWRAHKSHYYQRLIRMGWSHRRTALAEYALMLVTGLAALWGIDRPALAQAALIGALLALYALFAWRIDIAWRHRRKDSVESA
jgi:UDP-N-acetylmuramyl pentapeptide phosphotransferase/UDP-N-acetylglucosamine-1-phosphate transferase